MRHCFLLLLGLVPFGTWSMRMGGDRDPNADVPLKVEAAGLHNVLRVTDDLYSGSSPDDDIAFRSLQKLGIRTIISVDGARPLVELARKYSMRYVHLPIGYDGVPREQALMIAKAVRELPGPVYLHCHHGKHRGPAAAAVVKLCLDKQCTVAAALEVMRKAGTDPHYTGLFAAPKTILRPTTKEFADLRADFPETASVAAMAQVMVNIDHRFDFLKVAQAAGWKAPREFPDIDPPHEARLLVEQYREAARLPGAASRPADFRRWLDEAEQSAKRLEDSLRTSKQKTTDLSAANKSFRDIANSCKQCHAKYRDVPQAR